MTTNHVILLVFMVVLIAVYLYLVTPVGEYLNKVLDLTPVEILRALAKRKKLVVDYAKLDRMERELGLGPYGDDYIPATLAETKAIEPCTNPLATQLERELQERAGSRAFCGVAPIRYVGKPPPKLPPKEQTPQPVWRMRIVPPDTGRRERRV